LVDASYFEAAASRLQGDCSGLFSPASVQLVRRGLLL